MAEKHNKYTQRGVYFSAKTNAMIDRWIGLHPHVRVSHLVREALFEYFENHPMKETEDVGTDDNLLSDRHRNTP